MEQLNLIEAIHELYENPEAKGIFATIEGWSYTIKRDGEEGELLAWWSTKRAEEG